MLLLEGPLELAEVGVQSLLLQEEDIHLRGRARGRGREGGGEGSACYWAFRRHHGRGKYGGVGGTGSAAAAVDEVAVAGRDVGRAEVGERAF